MFVLPTTFGHLRELRAAARNAHFIEYTFEKNPQGRYGFTSYTLDPRVVAICNEMDAKAREAQAKRVATGVQPAAKPPRQPKHEGELPITKQIRNWVHAHPNCVKAEALAAFPGVNPSTVGVQFGKAKRGEV